MPRDHLDGCDLFSREVNKLDPFRIIQSHVSTGAPMHGYLGVFLGKEISGARSTASSSQVLKTRGRPVCICTCQLSIGHREYGS
jgi:hypothetical protein